MMTTLEEPLLLIVFASTLLILALHPLEWVKIRFYRQTAPSAVKTSAGLGFLTRGLDVESYYYLFVLAFLLAFYRELILLVIVLVMVMAHIAARRDVSHAPSVLRKGKHVAGMLAFDILEVVFLVFLLSELWPLIVVTL